MPKLSKSALAERAERLSGHERPVEAPEKAQAVRKGSKTRSRAPGTGVAYAPSGKPITPEIVDRVEVEDLGGGWVEVREYHGRRCVAQSVRKKEA